MLFSREYLESCFPRREMWKGREPMHGDSYVDLKRGPRVVQVGEESDVDYADPNIVYIPDADALLDTVDWLIGEAGLARDSVRILLAFNQDHQWHAELHWMDVLTESVDNESPQEALTNLVIQAWGFLKHKKSQSK